MTGPPNIEQVIPSTEQRVKNVELELAMLGSGSLAGCRVAGDSFEFDGFGEAGHTFTFEEDPVRGFDTDGWLSGGDLIAPREGIALVMANVLHRWTVSGGGGANATYFAQSGLIRGGNELGIEQIHTNFRSAGGLGLTQTLNSPVRLEEGDRILVRASQDAGGTANEFILGFAAVIWIS